MWKRERHAPPDGLKREAVRAVGVLRAGWHFPEEYVGRKTRGQNGAVDRQVPSALPSLALRVAIVDQLQYF